MDGARIRAAAYLRRSTDHQDRSLGDQQAAIDCFAAARGYDLVNTYVDDAISGTSVIGRNSFLKMVDDAALLPRPFDCVLVYDVKRFGRMDNDETGYYRHLLRLRGVQVIYTSEQFIDEVLDDLIRPVKQWQARQESKDLAKVSIRGFLSKFYSRPGCWLSGGPPYGYDRKYLDRAGGFLFVARSMPNGSRRLLRENGRLIRTLASGERLAVAAGDHCRLVPGDPHHVAVVQRMFYECTRQGLGCQAIARRFNHECIPTPHDMGWSPRRRPGLWRYATIRTMLMNPAYAGDVAWNRNTVGTFFRIQNGVAVNKSRNDSRKLKRNRPEDWLVASDAHAAIVSRRCFQKAQEQMRIRRELSRRAVKDYHRHESDFRARYVLTGLIKCACCGSTFGGMRRSRLIRSRRSAPYNMAQMYCCLQQGTRRDRCRNGFMRQRVLEQAVTNTLEQWYERYMGGRGRREMSAAARRWARHVARVAGGPEGVKFTASGAQVWLASAEAFIGELCSHLRSPNPRDRRLAFRRCLRGIELDVPRRRLTLSVRRLPILEANTGGFVKVSVKLPADIGVKSVRVWHRGRDALINYTLPEFLAGKPQPVVDLFRSAREVMMGLGPEVRETVRHAYVAYSLKRHFATIRISRQRLLIYLKLHPQLIPNPPPFMRDVRGIGTQTTGNCELSVEGIDDLIRAQALQKRADVLRGLVA